MPVLQSGAVTRETFWTIGHVGEAAFYYLSAVAILVFVYGVYERVARYADAPADPVARLDDLPGRVARATRLLLTNEAQFDRDVYAGVMHTFVVWGFLVLLIGTTILAVDMELWTLLLGRDSFFVGDFYLSYSLVLDAFGLLFVVGVGMACWRRYGVRDPRLWGTHTDLADDAFVLTLLALGVGGYLVEALRILGTGFPSFETVSFVGYALALAGRTAGITPATAESVYAVAWWSHALLALGFVALLPYAKPVHMLTSLANVVTRDPKAGNRLPGVPEDAAPEDIGTASVEDFTWRELLDQDACTNCGRCSSVCPATAVGRDLDPRDVILDLQAYRESRAAGEDDLPIVADGGESVIAAESMTACLSCTACMDACPVDIEHVKQFTGMNRRLTESGEMDRNVQDAMMNAFQQGNVFGDPARTRPDWTDDLDFEVPDAREESVDLLWYVGDYPSYGERNRRVARSLARIFEAAGVSYGILHEDEVNDGNDVRRVGEEGLYETLAEDNAAAFEACEFDELVCTDPHSYNTFAHEYPETLDDFDAPVSHYTEVVERLVDEGRLSIPRTLDRSVTYHDPCHLGRMNDVYDAPRALIRATGATLVEMPRNRADAFCCGGGGGGVWTDVEEDVKPSEERLREAVEDTGPAVETFVVACPMCTTMFEDGRKTGGYEDDLDILDLTELLVAAMDAQADG
ncbi:heterodisulfide reductase-related iron-sulfur binding cluster [Haloplanus salilacus]|uniref:heterodisulfide reductase-related iron-sulfur binding cluster n=1 Tax=Haloplanus salilacus TaxID=2949994 RepID=UPI0030D0344C